jgi:hypothetical protein
MNHLQPLKSQMLGKKFGNAEVVMIAAHGRGYRVLCRIGKEFESMSLTNFHLNYGKAKEEKVFTDIDKAIAEANRMKRVHDQCHIVVATKKNEMIVTAKKNKPYLNYMYSTNDKRERA